jgi:hypothetical protein
MSRKNRYQSIPGQQGVGERGRALTGKGASKGVLQTSAERTAKSP